MIARDIREATREEGRRAFRSGIDGDDNPYRRCTQLAFDWEDGWEEEHISWSRAGRPVRTFEAA